MAQVPTGNFVPTTTPTALPDNMQRIDATPDAFGAAVAEGQSRIGAGLMQASDDASQYGLQRQQLNNQVSSDGAVNGYMNQARTLLYGDPSDPSKPGFLSLQGQDAMTAAPKVQQALIDLQKNLGANLNPMAQLQYDQESRRYQQMDMNLLAGKADQETQQFQAQTLGSTIANAHNAAAMNYNDPSALSYGLAKSDATVQQMATLKGWDPQTTQDMTMNARGAFFKTVSTSMAADSPMQANSFLDANRNNMPPDVYASLKSELKPRVTDAMGDQIAAGVIGNPAGGAAAIPTSANVNGIWHSMVGIESGGQQFASDGSTLSSGVGGADAPLGVAQIKPSTAQGVAASVGLPYDEARLKNDPAYNETLGKTYLQQQMTAFNDPTLAVAAYNAGPQTINDAIKTYGDPRTGAISMSDFVSHLPDETQKYVSRVASENGGSAPPSATPATYQVPDLSAQLQLVQQRTSGMDPDIQNRAYAKVVQNYSREQALNQTARVTLDGQLKDISSSYENGDTTPLIPEQQIKSLLPPDKAQAVISQLGIERTAGTFFKAVQWASPDDIAAARQQLENPATVQGSKIVAVKGGVAGPGAVTPPGVTPGPDDVTAPLAASPAAPAAPMNADEMGLRQAIASKYEGLLAQRNAALSSDPAGYVAASPALAPLAQMLQQPNPPANAMQLYTQASLAEQTRLGVQNPRILGDAQVKDLVGKIATMDPAKADVGGALDQMAGQYGSSWPQVFGEMVKYGKLDPSYQTLAAMDQPSQVVARADFQRALQAGSIKDIAGASDPQAIKNVDSALQDDGTLASFRTTTTAQSGGIGLMNNVADSVKRLSYYYVSQGQSANQAVQSATDGILNDKYDFSGTMRVPKGMMPNVNSAIVNVMGKLKPSDMQVVGGARGLTDGDNQNIIFQSAKQDGQWFPNADDTGLVLMRPLRNGGMLPVKLANGQPLQIKFSDAPALAAQGPAQPTGMDNEAQALGGL